MADGLAVLVTPDRGLRRGPRRPGRDGGLYAFIRRVIASGARRRAVQAQSQAHRDGVRQHQTAQRSTARRRRPATRSACVS